MRLFRSPVFSVTSVIGFVVGFSMLGALTFLPSYLQFAKGQTATHSGLSMLPMVVALLVASVFAGSMVSKTGRYKIFPIAGSGLTTFGLLLLSRIDETTSLWVFSFDLVVLGFGIGLTMQILTIIVQSTVDYRDLGVATSGVTFFRTLGGSFGAAIFGAVYTNRLDELLPAAFAAAPQVSPSAAGTPSALHTYPDDLIAPIVHAYAEAVQTVFLWAAPVAATAFVLGFFLKQVPLRETALAGARDLGEGFAMPDSQSSEVTLETAVARLLVRDLRSALPQLREQSGSALGEADGWCVAQVRLRGRHGMDTSLEAIGSVVRVPAGVLRPAFREAAGHGFLAEHDDGFALTEAGVREWGLFVTALKDWIRSRLPEPGPSDHGELDDALHRLTGRLLEEETTAAAESRDRVLAMTGGPDAAPGGREM